MSVWVLGEGGMVAVVAVMRVWGQVVAVVMRMWVWARAVLWWF